MKENVGSDLSKSISQKNKMKFRLPTYSDNYFFIKLLEWDISSYYPDISLHSEK